MLKTSRPWAAALATAVTLLAGSASAATVYETFTFGGTNMGARTSHNFSSGDLNLTVTARQHQQGNLSRQIRVGRWATGLGAQSRWDRDHKVDGSGPDEILLFDFGRQVTLEWVWFSYFDPADDVELGAYSGTTLTRYISDRPIYAAECQGPCNNRADDIGYAALRGAERLSGDILGIGADHWTDQFKISKIKVSYEDLTPVPLPASGLLLLGAAGGLGVMRKRKST